MKQPVPFSTNLLGYAALGTIVFSFICTCLALGLPYWEYYDVTDGSQKTVTNVGLWQYCIDYTPETSTLIDSCVDPVTRASSGATDVRAVRALVILALILEIMTGVLTILVTFRQRFQKDYKLHFAAVGTAIGSGFFSMIALAVYVDRIRRDDYDLHASSACDILSWLVSWTAAGFILFMASVKKGDEH